MVEVFSRIQQATCLNQEVVPTQNAVLQAPVSLLHRFLLLHVQMYYVQVIYEYNCSQRGVVL